MIGFSDEIRQVIDNLLLNALEATPAVGHLTVSVHRSRNWKHQQQQGVRLTISDGKWHSETEPLKTFRAILHNKA
jgi:signal transduction histidine kinase